MSKKTSIYSTEKYPATSIHQNHLDVIQGILYAFCLENKYYRWGVIIDSKKYESEDGSALKYISKYKPEKLKYYIESNKDNSELILNISDGVSISIKSGSYELYGLFGLLKDSCASMISPHIFMFFRKYWLLSVLIAGMVIPILVILLLGGGWWFLVWVLIGGLIETLILLSMLETSDWDDYILSTRIHYGEYNTKTIGFIGLIFGSAKGIISILASLATIITFIFFLVNR